MVMEEQVLRKLEYHRLLERLAGLAASTLGQEAARQWRPSLYLDAVRALQEETQQGRRVLEEDGRAPLAGIFDLREEIRRAYRGGRLEPGPLLQLLYTQKTARQLRGFLQERAEVAPRLDAWGRELQPLPELVRELERCITEEGGLADGASEQLRSLRRALRQLHNQIRDRLDGMVRSPEIQKYLQEPLITLRRDRFVLPVKQEYRSHVPGLVHSQSASGATLFVEPAAVVEMSNRLQDYQTREQREIDRILEELSRLVGRVGEALLTNQDLLSRLDLVFARARLAGEMEAVAPTFNDQGYMRLDQGRHPLLTGEVVPVDLELGHDFQALVITGPNTGGKTVTLKTVGLFALMAQSGFQVPAQSLDTFCFHGVFVDVGDEQSIEQNLSTFSGHMTNIVRILERCDQHSLVLLDELGAGTDPAEGAALGMGILDYLREQGTRTVATTHFSELKAFAYVTPGVENAAVEFDVETLQPTFRLLLGVAGRSNAFEIARRLGLAEDVLGRASEFRRQEEVRAESLIQELETDRVKAQHARVEAERAHYRVQQLEQETEATRRQLEEERQEVLQQARREALAIINRSRSRAEGIVEEMRRAPREGDRSGQDRLVQQAREEMGRLRREVDSSLQEQEKGPVREPPRDLKPGEEVWIRHLQKKGQVLQAPATDGKVLVQVGIMKVEVELEKLERREQESHTTVIRAPVLSSGTGRETSPRLDLRGYTAEEARLEVEKHLDDAVMAGLNQVEIIHGKGTGVLRQVVREMLRTHPQVRSYRLGQYGEGGSGVTLVELLR